MATHLDEPLDMREQLARIDQMRASTEKALADIQKTRVETQFLPRTMVFQAMIAFAAIFGAGAAVVKLFFP